VGKKLIASDMGEISCAHGPAHVTEKGADGSPTAGMSVARYTEIENPIWGVNWQKLVSVR
jgi:hypothetical protein